MHPIKMLFFLFALCVLCPAHAATISGRVVGVHDGDTLTLLTAEKRQVKIRLAEIDTPESAQPYGSRAKQALSDLVFGQDVLVDVQDIDRYGRTVGRVSVHGTDVNAAMVAAGAAWVYRQYAKDPDLLRWKPKRGPPSGDCGHSPRPSACRPGSGAGRNAKAEHRPPGPGGLRPPRQRIQPGFPVMVKPPAAR